MTTATATIPVPLAARPRLTGWLDVVPVLTARRLALTVRSPRSLLVPLMAPLLFALVVAPGLANSTAPPAQRTIAMTYFALATAGLLIPLNAMFSGLGVVLDRQHGAMPELLVAPIRRVSIVVGNLLAALAITAFQVTVLLVVAAIRGADFELGSQLGWFVLAALLLTVTMYSVAEVLAAFLRSPEEYTGALPAVAIVPFFFAGSLFPISSLPGWLAVIGRALPLTHALALFRYGLTDPGTRALHDIWGMSSAPTMAALSVLVLVAYSVLFVTVAVRVFSRAGTT
jgi:ABC-2 type transport system permease protein